jgi:VCBS repeat-containing protein
MGPPPTDQRGFSRANGVIDIGAVEMTDPPVVNDDKYHTNEDTVLNVPADSVLANDTDDNPLFVLDINTTGTLGSVTVNPNGSFSYNPTGSPILQSQGTGDTLDDIFIYTISDGSGGTDTAQVTVTIRGPDEPTPLDDTADNGTRGKGTGSAGDRSSDFIRPIFSGSGMDTGGGDGFFGLFGGGAGQVIRQMLSGFTGGISGNYEGSGVIMPGAGLSGFGIEGYSETQTDGGGDADTDKKDAPPDGKKRWFLLEEEGDEGDVEERRDDSGSEGHPTGEMVVPLPDKGLVYAPGFTDQIQMAAEKFEMERLALVKAVSGLATRHFVKAGMGCRIYQIWKDTSILTG